MLLYLINNSVGRRYMRTISDRIIREKIKMIDSGLMAKATESLSMRSRGSPGDREEGMPRQKQISLLLQSVYTIFVSDKQNEELKRVNI